jgi:putative redox protein
LAENVFMVCDSGSAAHSKSFLFELQWLFNDLTNGLIASTRAAHAARGKPCIVSMAAVAAQADPAPRAKRAAFLLARGLLAMECLVRWGGPSGMSFFAETGSGHLVALDGAADGGGHNLAPRPMELVLVGTGACTAYDVVLILKRGRHDVSGCEVKLLAERAPTDPKVFTRIEFHFMVRGRKLPREAVERAVQLSHEKYCSASVMMAKTAELTYSIEVIDEQA